VAYRLGEILDNNVKSGQLVNTAIKEIVGTTNTGLDKLIQAILTDEGLMARISTGDIRTGAQAANAMNHLIIEAIMAEGLANDGHLSTADIRQINHYLVTNHVEQ